MGKKILGGAGKLLGIGGKKQAAAAAAATSTAMPAEQTGPVIKQLGLPGTVAPRRRLNSAGTILSDKLGA